MSVRTESRPMELAASSGKPVWGHLSELFCSVQGEGIYIGEPQLFLRTAGCRLSCYWCDTVSSKSRRKRCVIHGPDRRSVPNPVSSVMAAEEALGLVAGRAIRTVSITGGEPLEQPEFVAAVAREFKERGLRVYLETSGVEVAALRQVAPLADVFAVDIKLPYATGRAYWAEHRDFLGCLRGRDVFVKVVVDHCTPPEEIARAVRLVAEIDPRIPLVLQPESLTYLKEANGAEALRTLRSLIADGQHMALKLLADVRIIPQCHRIWKVR